MSRLFCSIEDRYCNQEIAQSYTILAMNINKTSSKDDVIFFVGKWEYDHLYETNNFQSMVDNAIDYNIVLVLSF